MTFESNVNSSVDREREHEQAVGDEPERDDAEHPRPRGLLFESAQSAAQPTRLVRARAQRGLYQEDPDDAEDHAARREPELTYARDEPVRVLAHLDARHLLPKRPLVSLVTLPKAEAYEAEAHKPYQQTHEGQDHK